MPTISDVAKRAGVSPATVSRVIQGAKNVRPATREKVARAIDDLSYVPSAVAQSLRSKRTRSLALVVPDITNAFWTTVARGVEDVAHRHDYSVLLCNTDENLAKQLRYLDVLIGQQDGHLHWHGLRQLDPQPRGAGGKGRMSVVKRLFQRRSLHTPSPATMTLSYVLLGIWALVVLFPLYWLLVTSFKLPIDVNMGPFYLPGVDFKPSLHAWEYILVGDLSRDTIRPYTNTVIVALTSAALALILGTAAAYGLTRFQYQPRLGAILCFIGCLALAVVAVTLGVPWQIALVVALVLFIILLQTIGKRFQRSLSNRDVAFWLISQRMLPPVAVVIPIYVLFQRLRLLDTRTALIITYLASNLPIVVWLMRDYFQTIPIELEECAAIDGASRYRIFWAIVLPLALPGLVATFLFVLVFAWNEYLLSLFLSSSRAQTLPLTVAAQNATRGPQWWYMSVLILIMIVPVIAMAVALERYIARGLLVGAIKG